MVASCTLKVVSNLRVVSILNRAGQELTLFGPGILEPPQVLGVENFGDSQVTLRIVTKTRPLKQWETARELRKRIKAAFDREGIEMPFPHRVVYSRATPKPSSRKRERVAALEELALEPGSEGVMAAETFLLVVRHASGAEALLCFTTNL